MERNNSHSSNGRRTGPAMMHVLTERDLDMIVAYRYKPGTYTVVDNAMTPFWNWAVTLLPRWMAPNLVTLIGLAVAGASTGIIVAYCPSLALPVPRWCYVAAAAGQFIYQTMDAIDGKQARRTNSSSPLGQLFDHGCDALAKVFCVVAIVACLQFGASWRTMLVFTNIEAVFYLAQWEEYHTGTLNWSNGWFGVTESQLVQMGLFLLTACCGEDVWQTRLPLPAVVPATTAVEALVWIFTLFTISFFASSVGKVWTSKAHHLSSAEVGDKRIGPLPGLVQLVPMFLVYLMGFLLATGPAQAVFARHASLQVFTMGVVSTHLTSRMIVYHMAKKEVLLQDLTCPSFVALALTTANAYWETLGLGPASPVEQERVLVLCLVCALCSYLWYVWGVIHGMCTRLGIRCFRIPAQQYRRED